ncbi:hypothetical protein [Cryobacterium sp. SO1]|uniref:hypothetical protein n=1 Tax=Cryobacterium sp. SO1 TaxID=1897061 RepID=UPI00102394E3|nr:hypothetical protein [Cryobacterium sp. SO1]RZI36854.1 hypothetical protein BJQ95_00733 [Cryobacterium sp. SO1]
MSERIEVHAESHIVQFLNCRLPLPPHSPNLDSTGLIREGFEYPELHTGVWSGPVGVTVESRSGRPDEVDESWEDIAEFSAIVDDGPLVLCGFSEMPMPDWPRLDGFGPGTYRIRVHARGRDIADDAAVLEATEEYMIVTWLEKESPASLIALASHAGKSWIVAAEARPFSSFAGGMHAGTVPSSPAPTGSQPPTPLVIRTNPEHDPGQTGDS